MEGDLLKQMIFKRTGLTRHELGCPRQKSYMTPCIARDGDLAMTNEKICVGCEIQVTELIKKEKDFL